MAKLISIGEALVDIIKLPGKPVIFSPGGAPANVACAVSNLGQEAVLLSKLGDDDNGKLILEALRMKGVHTDYILTTDAHQTTVANVLVDKKGQRTFTFDRRNSADLFYRFQELPLDIFNEGDILHFGTVDLVPSLMKDAHSYALIHARKKQMIISFDPNLRFTLWPNDESLKQTVFEFMYYADILKLTDDELSFLYPNLTIDETINKIFLTKVKVIIISKGSLGVSLYRQGKPAIDIPGIQVEVVDTTGAGDALIGSFLASLLDADAKKDSFYLQDDLLKKSLVFANKVAAYVCTKPGAIEAFPTREIIKGFKIK
jgi:fructokinase